MRNWIWIALHCIVLLVPGVALVLHAPDARLIGSEFKTDLPTWSFHGWTEEKVQKEFQAWFESHLGFRGAMVRTDNTVFYESMGETKPESSVKRGTNDTLFILEDLKYGAWTKKDLPSAANIADLGGLVADTQRRLEARGKHLFLILAPSKTSIYPDEVPSEWRRGTSPSASADLSYEMLRTGLTNAGAKFTDGRALLTKSIGERELLFPRGARHWSRVGACRVLREAIRGVLTEPTCEYTMREIDPVATLHSDFDSYELLNTWHLPSSSSIPAIYMTQPPLAAEHPRALFDGTSFSFMLLAAARPVVVVDEFFYYNTTVYDVRTESERSVEPIDPKSPEWDRYVLNRDVYILEILEIWPEAPSIKAFLTALRERL